MLGRLLSKYKYGSAVPRENCDVVIVGGGIIGLATARELLIRHPKMRTKLLEKELQLATHQSRNNSGVIHAGIYYPARSYKAKLCVEGMTQSFAYCDQKKIPYKKLGKVIVAVEMWELPILESLMKNALINEIPDVRMIADDELMTIEPHCRGLRAIHSPRTGNVNWQAVANAYGEDFVQSGGQIRTGFEVTHIESSMDHLDYPILIRGMQRQGNQRRPFELQCKYLITCAGLQGDRVARMTGCPTIPKIIPFRGDFMILKPEKSHLVRGNIYPVPDARFPFLGAHFNSGLGESVLLGPNAVLSLRREGYGLMDFNLRDAVESLTYPGLQRMIYKYFGVGMNEWMRAFSIRAQMKYLQRFIPEISAEDVTRGPSGIRAQAVDKKGNLLDDFIMHQGTGSAGWRIVHVLGVPSPGATSSLPIARLLISKSETQFNWPSTRKEK